MVATTSISNLSQAEAVSISTAQNTHHLMDEIPMSTKPISIHQAKSVSSPVENQKLRGVLNNSPVNGQSTSWNTVEPVLPNIDITMQRQSPQLPVASVLPQLRIEKIVYRCIMLTIASQPPETGGILLGPIDSNDITDFYFDHSALSTGATYSPDHVTLNQMMKERWLPNGIDMKGFVHSHPRGVDRLSSGDLTYIARLLKSNDDMEFFAAPIVLPDQYRMCPFVVSRNAPQKALAAKLTLF